MSSHADWTARVWAGAEGPVEPTIDTIAAIATPPGRGAVGIVRLSGPGATIVAGRLVGQLPPPRHAALRDFHAGDGTTLDRGIVLYFPAPHSYTGEDVIELQGHGGQVITELVLRAALAAGARQAEAGEFSRRAYLNERLDLAQAEAVADLINAATEAAARAAQRSLHGEFSERVSALEQALIAVRVRVEGALDFSEEDANWFAADLDRAFDVALAQLDALLRVAQGGRRLTEGFVVALAGRPNAGKSTLLNRLCGAETAIVTPIPGTTRDVLREAVNLGGLPATVIDTAGLRATTNPIEREGVARARKAFSACELLLYLVDGRHGLTLNDRQLLDSLPHNVPRIIVFTKLDLMQPDDMAVRGAGDTASISAVTGAGLEDLVARIRTLAGVADNASTYSTRSRHIEALQRTRENVLQARARLQAREAAELAAEDLRVAQRALGEICGRFENEALLGRIFAGFCVGK
ncbi:MAG TPA: tRNA uridine-5-carboxymethylaminomethyl(34) synthesis GTPase MnmE [Nevskiaceae bacterium]|nr:tRNA uridine-5-carboxymethylaminomethyl(34) synthesis GTPase MnmE [Nevskiaceae bacterium]